MGKLRTNQLGFSAVEAFLLLVIVGILGFTGWYVWHAKQNADASLVSNNSATPVYKAASKSKTAEAKNVDKNAGYIVLKEWGLRFKVPSGITDVQYRVHDNTTAFYAKPTNSNVQYRSDYEMFADEGGATYALGVLYRMTESTQDKIGTTVEGKKLGNYYYYTNWAFSSLSTGAACVGLYDQNKENTDVTCQLEQKAFQLINQGDTALLNTIEVAQ